MAGEAQDQYGLYQILLFSYYKRVKCKFSGVSGLEIEAQVIEYRHGIVKNFQPLRCRVLKNSEM